MTKIKIFEEGKLYTKYVTGYKVTYRITKRTYKKIYFMSIAVELDEPISKFDAMLSCTKGVVADIADLFKEYSVSIEAARAWDLDVESFTVWNNTLGPLEVNASDEIKDNVK